MYVKHSQLSRNKQLELMKDFVVGSTARTVADLAGIHRNTAVRFFYKLRCTIAHEQHERAAQFTGEIALDESDFGGVRKGKRIRGSANKVAIFGIPQAWRQCVHADHFRYQNRYPYAYAHYSAENNA